MLGMVLVVSCIKRLQVVGVISDKDGNVAAMFHQVLFMLSLKVRTPLQTGSSYSHTGFFTGRGYILTSHTLLGFNCQFLK